MEYRPLAQDLLLLGLGPDGRVRGRNPGFDFALAGAVLLDLALAGRIDVVDKRVVPGSPAALGDPVLDDALVTIRQHPRGRPKYWVTRLSRHLRKQLHAQLVRADLTGMELRHVLRVFPTVRYPVSDPAAVADLRRRVDAAVRGGGPVEPRTAALCALLAPAGIDRMVVPDLPRRELRRRLAEISAGNWASEAVRAAVRDVQAAVSAVTVAVAVGATGS